MPCVRVDCESWGTARCFDRRDHFLRAAQGNAVIQRSMESPHRQIAQSPCAQRIAGAANRQDRGVPPGVPHRQIPGRIATHAQTREIDSRRIDTTALLHLINECFESQRIPPAALRTLRRNDDERKAAAILDEFWRTVSLYE